jgi:hypothetical protein
MHFRLLHDYCHFLEVGSGFRKQCYLPL